MLLFKQSNILIDDFVSSQGFKEVLIFNYKVRK